MCLFHYEFEMMFIDDMVHEFFSLWINQFVVVTM